MKSTFFPSRTRQMYAKASVISESTLKVTAISVWALMEIFLTAEFICKQRFMHENEILHILKTRNTQTLIKAILENSYNLLKIPWKTTTLRQPKHFSQTTQFLPTFYV